MSIKFYNDDKKEIVLNEKERLQANFWEQHLKNSLGYDVSITTMTTLLKKVSTQKFFEISPSDFLPIVVGEGAFSQTLLGYRSFSLSDDFDSGIINLGAGNSRTAEASAGVDSISTKVFPWAKSIGWSVFELESAIRAGNWDLITSLEFARKKNWDLGIQYKAFLGSDKLGIYGLLNQPSIVPNTTAITKPIGSMSTAELKVIVGTLLNLYRARVNRTAWPTALVVPESDMIAMSSQASSDFPIKSVLQLLEEAFQQVTNNKSFKILGCAYGDAAYNPMGKQAYALLNYDETSLRMTIPVDYTATLANTLNGFNFQNIAYGQFTGVQLYRDLELMYFQY